MSITERGAIVAVSEERPGASLAADAAAGATLLTLADVLDFDDPDEDDTLQLVNDDTGEVVAYTGVDRDANTLTVEPTPSTWSDGAMLRPYPVAVERWADVQITPEDDEHSGDTIAAVVPFTMWPLLPLGVRDGDDAEAATLAKQQPGDDWVLTDVAGTPPKIDARMIDAQTDIAFYHDVTDAASDGSQTMTLTWQPLDFSLHLYRNGSYQRQGVDFTIDARAVTFTATTGDVIAAEYAYRPIDTPPTPPDEPPDDGDGDGGVPAVYPDEPMVLVAEGGSDSLEAVTANAFASQTIPAGANLIAIVAVGGADHYVGYTSTTEVGDSQGGTWTYASWPAADTDVSPHYPTVMAYTTRTTVEMTTSDYFYARPRDNDGNQYGAAAQLAVLWVRADPADASDFITYGYTATAPLPWIGAPHGGTPSDSGYSTATDLSPLAGNRSRPDLDDYGPTIVLHATVAPTALYPTPDNPGLLQPIERNLYLGPYGTRWQLIDFGEDADAAITHEQSLTPTATAVTEGPLDPEDGWTRLAEFAQGIVRDDDTRWCFVSVRYIIVDYDGTPVYPTTRLYDLPIDITDEQLAWAGFAWYLHDEGSA